MLCFANAILSKRYAKNIVWGPRAGIIRSHFVRLLESPMFRKRWPCHAFLMCLTFRKVSFFLSFLDTKSRSQTSEKLVFRSYIFLHLLWIQNSKHRFRLVFTNTIWRSAFITFPFLLSTFSVFVLQRFCLPFWVTFYTFGPIPRPS